MYIYQLSGNLGLSLNLSLCLSLSSNLSLCLCLSLSLICEARLASCNNYLQADHRPAQEASLKNGHLNFYKKSLYICQRRYHKHTSRSLLNLTDQE